MLHPSKKTLWKYVTDELAVARRTKVREHALECQTCKREVHRAIAANRLLAGEDEQSPTKQELAVWGEEVLHRRMDKLQIRSWWYGLVAVGAAAGIAGVALLTPPPVEDDLVARGSKEEAVLHCRVLCVTSKPDAAAKINEATSGCHVGDYLKLMVGDTSHEKRRGVVLLVTGDELSLLYPSTWVSELPLLPKTLRPLSGSKLLKEHPAATSTRVALLALNESHISRNDPLIVWVQKAIPGVHRDVLSRADAVVTQIEVSGEKK